MFINKISGISQNIGFKSENHKVNNVGKTVLILNYPYDYENENCDVQIYKVKKTDKYNYQLIGEVGEPIEIKPEGTEVDLSRITDLDKDETFVRVVTRRDKKDGHIIWKGADTGVKMHIENGELVYRYHNDPAKTFAEYTPLNPDGTPKLDSEGKPIKIGYDYNSAIELQGSKREQDKYTLVAQKGTHPLVQGPAVLVIPDSFAPGWRYARFNENNTGELIFEPERQIEGELTIRTVSNSSGGSIAGIEANIEKLKANNIKKLPSTPMANGADRGSHGYYNKNNKQIQSNMGTTENFDSLMNKEFKNGINHVFDATLTSEGIEGIHARYALRWGEKAQTSRWFRMSGLKNAGLGFGVIPTDAKNFRHRLINPPYIYEKQPDGTYKKIVNDKYNSKQETLLQIYDASQVTVDQLKELDKPIEKYKELNAGRNLEICTYEDTLINYIFEVNPNEYDKNINKINDLVKKEGKKIDLNSPEGSLIATNLSNFHTDKTSDGYVAWDDNPDMIKMNYGISAYDEMELLAITDPAERQHERELRIRASKEVQDMAVQTGVYWTDKVNTAHILFTAQVLGKIKTAEQINKLVDEGKLPEEVRVSQDVIDNILNGEYSLEPKGLLNKDDTTVKSLMKLPLDTLEFGDNTAGVLSTSYFINLATTDETIGKSRFDLMKQGNPHLVKEYENVYNKVNGMFTNELKDFAHSVINKVNEKSDEPLINPDGSYTEYGEYVIDLLGRNIAKYALLKSLAGDSFAYKQLPNGNLTYDYENIKNATTLKALGINANNPEEEAQMLQRRMQKGLKGLAAQDVNVVADSISAIIKGSDKNTFRISEALVKLSGLGLDFRLDAAKDVMDIDSIRNRYSDFDDTWTNLINFWNKFVQGVKSVNPHSYIVAEMTDVADVLKDNYGGEGSCPYNGWTNVNGAKFNGEPDAMAKFFNETGITSEAAYSYFFTELLVNFSKEFERGEWGCDTHDAFKSKYDLLINTRSADYLRNLYTFIGNHDKTRTIHGLAIDMSLFHSTLMHDFSDYTKNRSQRMEVIKLLSGASDINQIPLELRLNVDNLDYFRTVSARAVAQSKLLSESIAEDLKGKISEEDIKLLQEALIDLANGNYLNSKITEKMTRINIPQLSTIENIVNEISNIAKKQGVALTDKEIQIIINNVKLLDFDNYLVHGDFDRKDEAGNKNKAYIKEILGDISEAKMSDYSLYTVQIARMIKDASKGTFAESSMGEVLKEFVNTYNRAKISENMNGFKMYEDPKLARKKNCYAANDFRTALEEAIAQAEFKSGRTIPNKELIISTVYKSITEPAMKKQAMMLSFLSGICGIPTTFAGDEYGDTGYEDKAKNTWVKNRNASRLSEIDKNTALGKMMKNYQTYTFDAMQHKANVKPLQNGTPYTMDVMAQGLSRDEIYKRIEEINKICSKENGLDENSELVKNLRKEQNSLRKELAKVAYMMQSTDGDMAISVFNASGINHDNRHNYFKDFDIEDKGKRLQFFKDNNIETLNIDNPYIPIQEKSSMDAILMGAGVAIPVGTVFINADSRDKAKYVVEQIGDRLGIVRKDGSKTGKIILDGITAKNGVMILRKLKNIAFKGSLNQQYHFSQNAYQINNKPEVGNQLSLVLR